MTADLVLAHAGEETIGVILPIVLIVVFLVLKARRDAGDPPDEDGSETSDSEPPSP